MNALFAGIIDKLFSKDKNQTDAPGARGRLSPRGNQAAQIIPMQRATRVEVMLKKYNIKPDVLVQSIQDMNPDAIPVSSLQHLVASCCLVPIALVAVTALVAYPAAYVLRPPLLAYTWQQSEPAWGSICCMSCSWFASFPELTL